MQKLTRRLLYLAIAWTAVLMMLGAYVRLEDAGLGCPDWPGCYGQLTAPDEAHEIARAEAVYGGDVHSGKGWKEMIHRYVAGGLGVLVLGLTPLLWRARQREHRSPIWAVAPLLIIIVQALFGMWTVTLKLMPAVVTGHLIGGMTLLMSLICLAAANAPKWQLPSTYRPYFWLALGLVIAQVILGAWVSTNYAALACNGFPLCQGQLTPPDGLLEALRPDRALGFTAAGDALGINHLAAIHWLHRLGAVLVILAVLQLVYRLWIATPLYSRVLLFALLLQIALGVANVLLALPLALAIAHHAGAAFLLASVVYGLVRLNPAPHLASLTNHPISLATETTTPVGARISL
jgi:cytochrome c oxidase assembly protein subunit 15